MYIFSWVHREITINVPQILLAPDLGKDARLDPTGGVGELGPLFSKVPVT